MKAILIQPRENNFLDSVLLYKTFEVSELRMDGAVLNIEDCDIFYPFECFVIVDIEQETKNLREIGRAFYDLNEGREEKIEMPEKIKEQAQLFGAYCNNKKISF